MAKYRSRNTQLVVQHLEGISRKLIDRYREIFSEFARRRNGVYALYNGDRLYYVGLARNLHTRLHSHLRDRHSESWDRFSVYLTSGDEHLKELESLVLRIASPRGNRNAGKFIVSEDLKPRFTRRMKEQWRLELDDLTGDWDDSEREPEPRKSRVHEEESGRTPVLARYIKKRFHIQRKYKGKLFIAHVRRNGTIMFAAESADARRLHGSVFASPSSAGQAATGKSCDGWRFWRFQDKTGEWVSLDVMRKSR
jgi:hypothetical protein